MKRVVVSLVAVTLIAAAPAQARPEGTCTAAQKQAARTALARFRQGMTKQRKAYFKSHKSAKQRKAFLRKQQAKLKRLKAAASCTLVVAPPPPPTPPPPPADTTPPGLVSAAVDASFLTVTFDEDVTVESPSFTVHVNGGASVPQSATVSGRTLTLTLAAEVGGEDVVRLDYAGGVKDAAGNAAVPFSGVVVANATPAPCAFTVGNGGLHGPGAMNEGATDRVLHPAAVGTLRVAVLWADFPDAPATESIPTLGDAIFRPAREAYATMSYGRLAVDFVLAPRWYRLPEPSTAYGLNQSQGAARKDDYVRTTIHAADGDIDFSGIDAVVLVPAAGSAADYASGTQRMPGSGIVTVDGREVRHAVLLGTQPIARDPMAAVVHELGHVLGLPDLYADVSAFGGWDPMSFAVSPGPELMAWHRWKLGWLDPSQRRCANPGRTVQATLAPLETPGGVKMLVAPLDATRALVVENRQPLGFDAGLCDKGVLVYTVDGSVTFPGGAPARLVPAHPGTDTDGALLGRCGPRYDAPLDLGPGEVSSLADPAGGVRIDVVSSDGRSYVVRLGR